MTFGWMTMFSAEDIEDMLIQAGSSAQLTRESLRRNSSDSVLKALYLGTSTPAGEGVTEPTMRRMSNILVFPSVVCILF